MSHNTKVLLGAIAILAAVALIGWFEAAVWNECRVDHSWFYCLRVLHG